MLNLDSRSRSKLVWVATLLTPVIAVQGVRFITNSSTSAASAASNPGGAADMPVLPTVEATKAITPVQSHALKWLESRTGPASHRSPMDRPDQAASAPVEPDTRPITPITPDAPKPTDDAPRDLVLTGIIDGGADSLALCTISHRIHRVGDEVWPSWRIARIDGRRRLVVISGPDGRTALLSPPTPSPDR
jgi:hypothetical protein